MTYFRQKQAHVSQEHKNTWSNTTGDLLLTAAVITYLSGASPDVRDEKIKQWKGMITQKLSVSEKFSLVTTLADPSEIRAWNIFGLSTSRHSIDTILVTQ